MHPYSLLLRNLRVLAACYIGFGLASLGTAARAGDEVVWQQDIAAGFDAAKSEQKYVIADVYTDWCHWCKKMDRSTFVDPSLAQYLNGKFVCIKVNAEDHGPGEKMSKLYKVMGFPCTLVFDRSGKFIGKIAGYYPANQYQHELIELTEHPPADPSK